MNRLVWVVAAIVSLTAQQAFAACSGPFLTQANLHTLLDGSTASSPGSSNCEYHDTATGHVVDWKLGTGPGSANDPTAYIGGYVIGAGPTGAVVTYTYLGGGGTFKYLVTQTGTNTYNFCISTSPYTTYSVIVTSGQHAC